MQAASALDCQANQDLHTVEAGVDHKQLHAGPYSKATRCQLEVEGGWE